MLSDPSRYCRIATALAKAMELQKELEGVYGETKRRWFEEAPPKKYWFHGLVGTKPQVQFWPRRLSHVAQKHNGTPMDKEQGQRRAGDGLELTGPERHFDGSTTAWLIGNYVKYLNVDEGNKQGQLALARVIELLRSRKDTVEIAIQLARTTAAQDASLRWVLFHLFAALEDPSAAEFLFRSVVAPLPEAGKRSCEGPLDSELLVRTMAIEALRGICVKHDEPRNLLLKLVAQRSSTPLHVEAVKAAVSLGLRDKVKELLAKEDHWILDLKRLPVEELKVEHELKDMKGRLRTPPMMGGGKAKPKVTCCEHTTKTEDHG